MLLPMKQKIKISSILPYLFPFLMVLLFLLPRSYHLFSDLLFHRDQGLHSLSIWQIWHEGKFSLLGHPSDVDGLFHAPIYYWLMLPAYALSGGDPAVASLFQIGLEALSLPFLFIALKRLFNSKTAHLTLILYTFSYGLICYSRWLVNVTPILALTNFLLFFLSFKKQNQKTLFVSALLVGVITQCNAAIGVFRFPFLLWLYLRPFKFSKLIVLFFAFLLPAFPLLVFELRHDFVLSNALFGFSAGGQGLGLPFKTLISNSGIFFTEMSHLISYPFFWPAIIVFLLGLFQVRRLEHRNFIYAYLFIPFISLAFFQRGAISFFFVSLFSLSLAVIAYFISSLSRPLMAIIIFSFICLNVSGLPLIYQPTNALIPIGNANIITLQDRKNIIDWMYIQSDGDPFSVWFYTIPYFQEEVWDYMFLWYGQEQYGYLPEKTSSFSRADLQESKLFFAVWEPDVDQPSKFNSWQQDVINNFGHPVKGFSTHDLWVSKYQL